MHDFSPGSQYAMIFFKMLNILQYISGVCVLIGIVVVCYYIFWIFFEKTFLNPLAEKAIKSAKGLDNENIKK